jgi:hypothetical protein
MSPLVFTIYILGLFATPIEIALKSLRLEASLCFPDWMDSIRDFLSLFRNSSSKSTWERCSHCENDNCCCSSLSKEIMAAGTSSWGYSSTEVSLKEIMLTFCWVRLDFTALVPSEKETPSN